MSQVDWHIVKDVFYTALNRPAAERSGFLASACGDNEVLRSEVEFLLDSYESGFLEKPLLGKLAPKTKPDDPLFEVGRTFSHYRIIQLLGRGGMGEVYLADDLALDRLAAIKVIHADSGFGDQSAARLLREARSAAKLDHANICQVYEVGDADGHPFIAMQYVEGELLDSLIGQDRVTFDDAVSFTRQIARGLAKAHSFGIVHRDIKPSNIIVDSRKRLKVLDFGLAKETLLNSEDVGLSSVGLIAGTVTYMSPEHARGQEIDGQTDIWSLGVVFYQMVAGKLPFRGETRADLIVSILNDEIDDPGDVPPAVRYILGRALEKDRSLRYASVDAFEADLAELAETGTLAAHADALVPATAPAPAPATATAPFPIFRYAIAAALLLAIVGGGFGFWRYRSANAGGRSFSGAAASIQASTIFDQKMKTEGVALGLSFSPDGSMLAFAMTNAETHDYAIYVQRVAGGEPVRVTGDGGICFSPVWSPDGQRIAYLRSDDDGGVYAAWSVSFTGGESDLMREIGAYKRGLRLLKWSNDGTELFLGSPENIDRVNIATGSAVPISLNGVDGIGHSASISPDETRVAALRTLDGISGVWVKTIDANDAKLVTDGINVMDAPSWFPDGQWFAFDGRKDGVDQIFVQGLDGSPPRQATFGDRNTGIPAVSPAGGRIAYIASNNEANLFMSDIGSGAEAPITSKTSVQMFPAVSPEGQKIAYGTISDPVDLFGGKLKVEPFGTADTAAGSQTVPNVGWSRWSPDGGSLIFMRKAGGVTNIWTYSLADRSERQITTRGVSLSEYTIFPLEFLRFPAALSADGNDIVYVSRSSGRDNLWTVRTDGTDERMITDYQGDAFRLYSPRWSSDGRIAFLRSAGAGGLSQHPNSFVTTHENGNLTDRVEFKSDAKILGWTAANDGVYIAAAADDGWNVYLVPANGLGTKRIVARLPGAVQHSMRISPDQKAIVYTSRTGGLDDLYIVPLSGGEARRVTANTDPNMHYSGVTWTPDQRSLVYGKQTRGMQINMLTDTETVNIK